jgi:hypothetical protein
VLCMRRAIPYHITFAGPALALATLLTYMPSRTGAAAPIRSCSQVQVLRQASVDVRCVFRFQTHHTHIHTHTKKKRGGRAQPS